MAELIGTLSAVTGLLEQSTELCRQLKLRHDATSLHYSQFSDVLTTYKRLSNSLRGINATDTDDLSEDGRAQVSANVAELETLIEAARSGLELKLQKMASKRYIFTRARRNEEFIAGLRADAKHCTLLISNISCLLAVVKLLTQVVAAFPAPSACPVAPHDDAEQFAPSFFVESSERRLALDFEARTASGKFATVEGRLKAMVLGNGAAVGAVAGAVGPVAVGLGGVGKTCALRAIALHPDIRHRFRGGVYFRSLGKDAGAGDVVQMLSYFVERSGGRRLSAEIRGEGLDDAVVKVCVWFRDHSCLFVVDDVWRSADMPHNILAKLSQLSNASAAPDGGSRMVYSTRDISVAASACGLVVPFDRRAVRGPEARKMLLNSATEEDVIALRDSIVEEHIGSVLDVCGGLPFTLNITGRLAFKMKKEWGNDHVVEAWKTCIEILQKSDYLLNKEGESLFVSLKASLEFLMTNRGSFGQPYERVIESFCVFKRQDWVPFTVCKHLWGTDNEDDAEFIVDNLQDFGIVESTFRIVDGERRKGIYFHDHIHGYAIWLTKRRGGENS